MSNRKRLSTWLEAYRALGDVIQTTVYLVAFFALLVTGFLILGDADVPAWVPLVVLVAVPVAYIAGYLLRRPSGMTPAPTDAVTPPPQDVNTLRPDELAAQIAQTEYGKGLLYDALESIQLAVSTEEGWQLDQLVERGVLGPARGLLTRTPGEDVRMSVLVPRDDPATRWRMRWAAGHRPESVRTYDREIDETMAGLAFRRKDFIICGNVREDDRFKPHPKESRPFLQLGSPQ